MTNTSSLKRLRDLPVVFTHNTVCSMFGWNSYVASNYIARWKKQELVSSLGKKTGVHFNLLKDPEADKKYFLDAVQYLFPEAVLIGASALHDAGATTQIPRRFEIAIRYRPSHPKIPGTEIVTRPLSWFVKVQEEKVQEMVIPRLTPEYALADDWVHEGWRPDPDDVEWDEIDPEKLSVAFSAFKGDVPDVWREAIEDEHSCGMN